MSKSNNHYKNWKSAQAAKENLENKYQGLCKKVRKERAILSCLILLLAALAAFGLAN